MQIKKAGPEGTRFSMKSCYEDLFSSNDVDYTATAGGPKLHNTGLECEERVVFSPTDIRTGVKMCSTLAHNYFTSVYRLTSKALYA